MALLCFAGEIDRCLKKVTEGVDKFEEIWQKVHNASSTNQKEKFEEELKKEIKKLQRLRDQIKTWIASGSINDKTVLVEKRKLIEQQMERFKIVERETKTKAYSKEGLTSANKLDPAEKERADVARWLNECIDSLNIQMDSFEAEIETLGAATSKKKKGKSNANSDSNANANAEQIDEYSELLEKHREHISKIETLLRMLDNDTVNVEQIKDIKDDVEYYIENCQEPDFQENEFIYTEIDGLEEMLLEVSNPAGTSTTPSSSKQQQQKEQKDQQHQQHQQNDHSASSSARVSESGDSSTGNNNSSSTSVTTAAIATPSSVSTSTQQHNHHSNEIEKRRHKSSSEDGGGGGLKSNNSILTASSSSPSSSATTTTAAAAAAAATTNNNKGPSSSLSATAPKVNHSSVTTSSSPLTNTTSSTASSAKSLPPLLNRFAAVASSNNNSSSSSSGQQQQHNNNSNNNSSSLAGLNLMHSSSSTVAESGRSSSSTSAPSSAGIIQSTISTTSSTTLTSSSTSTSATQQPNFAAAVQQLNGHDQQQRPQTAASPSTDRNAAASPAKDLPSLRSMAQGALSSTATSSTGKVSSSAPQPTSTSAPSSKQPAQQQQQVNNSGEAHIPPLLGVAPLGPVTFNKETRFQYQMLEAAFQHMPHPSDSERLRPYLPRNPIPTPVYYPQLPPQGADSIEFFSRLSTETLFFIFYYMEGTKAQYLAARALKKQSWRFHTKYMMWFQRHEEPKIINDEFEQVNSMAG